MLKMGFKKGVVMKKFVIALLASVSVVSAWAQAANGIGSFGNSQGALFQDAPNSSVTPRQGARFSNGQTINLGDANAFVILRYDDRCALEVRGPRTNFVIPDADNACPGVVSEAGRVSLPLLLLGVTAIAVVANNNNNKSVSAQ
jgi:hypothetical protein